MTGTPFGLGLSFCVFEWENWITVFSESATAPMLRSSAALVQPAFPLACLGLPSEPSVALVVTDDKSLHLAEPRLDMGAERHTPCLVTGRRTENVQRAERVFSSSSSYPPAQLCGKWRVRCPGDFNTLLFSDRGTKACFLVKGSRETFTQAGHRGGGSRSCQGRWNRPQAVTIVCPVRPLCCLRASWAASGRGKAGVKAVLGTA